MFTSSRHGRPSGPDLDLAEPASVRHTARATSDTRAEPCLEAHAQERLRRERA